MRQYFILPLVFLIGIATTSWAQTDRNSSPNVQKIGEAFSVSEQLNQLVDGTYNELSQNPLALPSEENELLLTNFANAFAADRLLEEAYQIIEKQIQPDVTKQIVDWLNTKNGQKVSKIHREFFTIQGMRKQIVAKYELEQKPPSSHRKTLIDSLVSLTSATNSAVESQAIIFKAYLIAYSQLSNTQSFSESQVEGFVQKYRTQIREPADQQVHTQFLLMYHESDENLLKELTEFYDSKAGQRLHDILDQAILTALDNAANRFIDTISS